VKLDNKYISIGKDKLIDFIIKKPNLLIFITNLLMIIFTEFQSQQYFFIDNYEYKLLEELIIFYINNNDFNED
jgi:hypothetical protein